MIDVFPFAGYPVAVFGLGQSGVATSLALVKSQAEVWAWDDNEGARIRAAEEGVPLVNLYDCNWRDVTSLVLTPGVPLNYPEPHPLVKKAREAKCEIIGDIELLSRTQRWCSYIGVTGTNGKSTTTALLGHIMQIAGREAEVGGNLGIPALSLEPLGPAGTYILEMSSYQLDLTLSVTFDIAVFLNLSKDHLDRHGGMNGYVTAKRRIFKRQTKPRTAVIGVDDDLSCSIFDEMREANEQVVIGISGHQVVPGGVYVREGVLIDDTENSATPICNLHENPSLQGFHNGQNAAAAYAAAKTAGVAPHAIMACIQSYPGLVHRQEPLAVVDGITFVNDSKATNVDSAAKAIASYTDIFWIAGGTPKDTSLGAIEQELCHVHHAYLIGDAAMALSHSLAETVPFTLAGDLETATHLAFAAAREAVAERPVVLLSPACASFDQFENFEARGDAFRKIVEKLPGTHTDPFEGPWMYSETSNSRSGTESGGEKK